MENTTVLLIEDSTIALIGAIVVLQKFNVEVDVAKNGLEALNLAHRKKYNFILLDLSLPDLSGEEVIRKLRSNTQGLTATDLVITVLTAYSKSNYKKQFDKLDVNKFLTKPLQYKKLEKILNSCNKPVNSFLEGTKMTNKFNGKIINKLAAI